MSSPILIPLDIQEIASANVPTPESGYIAVFAEGWKLKQKNSSGVVTDLTATGGGGWWFDQNVFIQTTEPTVTVPSLWIDTTGGNFQFKYVTP